MTDYKAFTLTANDLLDRLKTNVYVYSKYTSTSSFQSPEWDAVWDTGAMTTCISKRVVDKLNLIPIGMGKSSTAGGVIDTNLYCVDIILPNNVIINDLNVVGVEIADCDVLIGMDIIKNGDFIITNHEQKTTFSFRIPSISRVDYVDEYNNQKGL